MSWNKPTRKKILWWTIKTIEYLSLGTIGLIGAPWKFDVLKTSIFAIEASLLGQIFVLGMLGEVHLIWQGRGGGVKILRGAPKIFRHPTIYILQNQQEEGGGGVELLRNWTAREGGGGGLLKFQASGFNIFIPPPPSRCNIKWTFPQGRSRENFLTLIFCWKFCFWKMMS